MQSNTDATIWGIIFAMYGSFSFFLIGAYFWQDLIKKKKSKHLARISLLWTIGIGVLITLYQIQITVLGCLLLSLLTFMPFGLKMLANKNRKKAGLPPFTFKGYFTQLSKPKKNILLIGAVWLIYVGIRSNDNLEILGIDLQRWDPDFFFINAGIGVFVIFCFVNFKKIRLWLSD